ncbi:MAG: hypothetical protein U9O65_00840 [Thermotogota bacterium]|nr:hypothetical protein [Thermotogota bacterium]
MKKLLLIILVTTVLFCSFSFILHIPDLREKYYGEIEHKKIYYYDLLFYEYLKEIEFNSDEISLKEASFNFFEETLQN